MEGRICGNEYRTTMVCVDECDERGVISGRLYNPCLAEGETFRSLMEFIWKTEELLDQTRLPQAFAESRSFVKTARYGLAAPPKQLPREGKLGTFALRVLFRQNASWQGSVTWLEGGREEHFRSALELLHLMESALGTAEQARQENIPVSC